jgi:uncharacterized damage-inducible protein DinB
LKLHPKETDPMLTSVQEFLAEATQKADDDLTVALELIPQEKRSWKPTAAARSALDQIAECAILNGSIVNMIENRYGPPAEFMAKFVSVKEALAQDEEAARALLETNTALVIAAIQAVPDEELDTNIPLPWGPKTWGTKTLRDICAHPYWNMTYHQGQIVYIASLLGEQP